MVKGQSEWNLEQAASNRDLSNASKQVQSQTKHNAKSLRGHQAIQQFRFTSSNMSDHSKAQSSAARACSKSSSELPRRAKHATGRELPESVKSYQSVLSTSSSLNSYVLTHAFAYLQQFCPLLAYSTVHPLQDRQQLHPLALPACFLSSSLPLCSDPCGVHAAASGRIGILCRHRAASASHAEDKCHEA